MFNKYVYIIVCNTILHNITAILTKLDFECDSGKKSTENLSRVTICLIPILKNS